MLFLFKEGGRLIFASLQSLLIDTTRPFPKWLLNGPLFDSKNMLTVVAEGVVILGGPQG